MRRLLPVLLCLLLGKLWAVSLPPAPLQNHCPVVIVNNSAVVDPSKIYFVAHGNDPNGLPCFLVPNSSTGICAIVYPHPSGTPGSISSSVALSDLPTAQGISGQAYLIYLPINSASRAYLSIDHPMVLATAFNPATGVFGIDDSSVTSLQDPNYYTLYQDFEFGLIDGATDSTTNIYLNLSWVDYFCLPMQLYTYTYPTDVPITDTGSPPSGMLATLTRENIITTTNSALASGQSYPSWGNLGIAYYTNPYTDTVPTTYLRILAAKNSISLGSTPTASRFKGALTPQLYFPADYASSTVHYAIPPQNSNPAQSLFTAAYNYYLNGANALFARIFPANESPTVYELSSTGDATNLTLQFISADVGSPSPITLDLAGVNGLTTEQLFSGSQWPFFPTDTNASYTNELSKLVSALFTVGQFPFTAITTSVGSPFVNNNDGYATLSYFSNPPGYSNGPWFNLYDQLLHKKMISQGDVPNNSSLGLGYAYDFDDLLNMSGLVNGIVIQNQYGNPSLTTDASQPFIVISLENMTGTPIPNISTDVYNYPVNISTAPNGVAVSFSYYNVSGILQTVDALPDSTPATFTVYASETQPFQINFTFNSQTYTFNINLQRQIVTPATNSFSQTDQYFQSGVTFDVTGGTTPTFTINFNSVPPPWPG